MAGVMPKRQPNLAPYPLAGQPQAIRTGQPEKGGWCWAGSRGTWARCAHLPAGCWNLAGDFLTVGTYLEPRRQSTKNGHLLM